jgi:hypothetical protein
MRGVDLPSLPSRIKGRYSLERRLYGLLRATWRFAQGRATSPEDRAWSARMIDGLTALLPAGKQPTGTGRKPLLVNMLDTSRS